MTSAALDPSADATLVFESAPVPHAPAARAARAAAGAELCTNCGIERAGLYCAVCGQQFTRGRLTVPAIAHQVAGDVLNVDRGILFTALELTRRPGDAIRDYVDGKRVRYTGPVKYFVLTVALTTFASTQLGLLDEMASGMVEDAGGAAVTVAQASAFMSQWMTLFMALGVPFTAAVTSRLFKRAGMTYAEHLALNLYSYGQQCLGLVLTILVITVLPRWEEVLVLGWLLASTAYFGWTCTRFFRVPARSAAPRAAVGMVLGTLAYFLAAALILSAGLGVAGL